MTARREGLLTDWYSRVVFGVIAVSLAMLAVQGAWTVEPVLHAQGSECGNSRFNPCYVEVKESGCGNASYKPCYVKMVD